MPKVIDTPRGVRPFLFHGVLLDWAGRDQAKGDCPFCAAPKLHVNCETGLWDCKSCHAAGNPLTFYRMLYEASDRATTDYNGLTADRGLLQEGTLLHWGLVKSVVTGEWLAPAYGAAGKLVQLYRYSRASPGARATMWASPLDSGGQVVQGLFGVPLYDAGRPDVYLCEGLWDSAATWEVLRNVKRDEGGGYGLTASEEVSLLSGVNVLGVPGSGVMLESWAPLLAGKRVFLLYDSDRPTESNGVKVDGAGLAGMKRAAWAMAAKFESKPASVHYLNWGPGGFDPAKPNKHDLRDELKAGARLLDRAALLDALLKRVEPVPDSWTGGRAKSAEKGGKAELETLPCRDWNTLRNSCRRAMKWSASGRGLDHALAVMLAVITSTRALGDQLWVKVIGPAGCGKSTLCEAVSVNKRHVYAKSTIRGFHSGYKSDREGAEDHSLIPKVRDKTLVTKDGDTLLQSPNKDLILSEARDLYDSVARVHYRHGIDRNHEGVRMTWLLCGTSALRAIDSSELGERFLDCVIMEGIDDDMEDDVLNRVAHRSARNVSLAADGAAESQHDPDMVTMMRLTGGYIDHLRDNAPHLLAAVTFPDRAMRTCVRLGKFVAYARARPSKRQEETAEREFAARLVSQLVRMAKCLAVVLNKRRVDEEVMARVARVAMDTARGRTLEIVRRLYDCGEAGILLKGLCLELGQSGDKLGPYLKFLRDIGVAEWYKVALTPGLDSQPKWRLTARLRQLYDDVTNEMNYQFDDQE